MSEKSELEYLLDALKGEVHPRWLNLAIRRAIERRKQDLAQRNQLWDAKEVMQDAGKSNPTGNAQPGAAHPADNTPKGGGDATDATQWKRWRVNLTALGGWDNELVSIPAGAVRKIIEAGDALLAERDAARAELKEALDLLRKNVQLGMTPLICAPTLHDDVSNFLDRVGKQP